MSARPYFRHTIDQLEAMPADATLIAELELRTTPRARKLLASLKATVAAAPVPVERVAPVAKAKRPAKGIARPRAAVVPSTTTGDWASLSKADRAFFERVMPWVFDGRTPVHTPAEYIKMHKDGVRKLKATNGPAYKRVPKGTGDWSLCPLNSMPFVDRETQRVGNQGWIVHRRNGEFIPSVPKPETVEMPLAA